MGDEEKVESGEKASHYLWTFLRRFGRECYRTWRQELMASVLVCIAVFAIACARGDPHAWADLKTALLASGIVLAGFAVWHLGRTPFLVHKDVSDGAKPLGGLYGIFGSIVVLVLLSAVVGVTVFTVDIIHKNSATQVATNAGQSSQQQTEKSTGSVSGGQQGATGTTAGTSAGGQTGATKSAASDVSASDSQGHKRSATALTRSPIQTPPVQNPVSSPMPIPPKQQLCVQGNICNQDSPVNAPQTVNNYGQKPPEILGYELVPTSDLRVKPRDLSLAVTNFKFYTGSVWDDPKFAVICDRPCRAYAMDYVSPPPVIVGPIFEAGVFPDAPNFAVFVPTIKPFPADRYFVFTVASGDSTPVQIIRVAPLVAPVKPR